MSILDINITIEYPYKLLSNLHKNFFTIDGIDCGSMEGFIQSLKFEDENMQRHICSLNGAKAKTAGRSVEWWRKQELWWKGKAYQRDSKEYQDLLNQAFYEMLIQNERVRNALLDTVGHEIVHTIGGTNPKKTVLTQDEYCSRLIKMREGILKGIV